MQSSQGNCTPWELGKIKSVEGDIQLCYNGFHTYADPRLAAIFNPIHGNMKNPRLFECYVFGDSCDDGTKSVHRHCKLLKEVEIPDISVEKRVEFAI